MAFLGKIKSILIPSVPYMPADEIESLFKVLAEYWNETKPVELDFCDCDYIGANGIAALSMFKRERDRLGFQTTYKLPDASPKVLGPLVKFGFMGLFSSDQSVPLDSHDAIPIFLVENFEAGEVLAHIDYQLTKQANQLPRMNEALARETKKSLFELIANIFQHSESEIGGVLTGQFHVRHDEFQICICDCGLGVSQRVMRAKPEFTSCSTALSWAVEGGNSTRDSDIPGGLGLHLLRDFVKVNEGLFRLCANNGVVSELAGVQTAHDHSFSFPGTLIELRLKVKENFVYCLSERIEA